VCVCVCVHTKTRVSMRSFREIASFTNARKIHNTGLFYTVDRAILSDFLSFSPINNVQPQ